MLFALAWCAASLAVAQPGTTLFDDGWKFHKGGALSAEYSWFDDSKWRLVDLPHDWSIEDLPGTSSPFNPDAISSVSGGFATGGTGWYRKTFQLPANQKGKRVMIRFDGIYMNADVWINGVLLGTHPYGYTSFHLDLTGHVKYGEANVLSVKVKNEGENSRWYSGSGIYRHVWMIVKEPVHIAPWGVTVVATPEAAADVAKVNLRTVIDNASGEISEITLRTQIVDAKGIEAARAESTQAVKGSASATVEQMVAVKSPVRWSLENPALYKAITEIFKGTQLLDRTETTFGIRSVSFDAAKGFLLNGKPVKLKGGCVHHDNGPLGSKAYDRAEERRVELLKASGYNAIRGSHNPPSPAFLDACDRLGMLVIDEAFDMWRDGKNPYDYHLYFNEWWQRDLTSMVERDRNHPSVIVWSIGNEIPGMDDPAVVETAKELATYIRKLDPTRPVTAGVNSLSEKKDPFFAALDIGGYNYAAGGDHNQKSIYDLDHGRKPQRIMFGSESYPLEAFGSWVGVTDHPWVIGDFVWTAFDYIGEASIGWRGYWQEQNFYPWTLAYCGDIDICGWKRPQSYYRDALWMNDQLSVFVKPPQPSFEVNPKRESWSKWHWHDVVADWNWKGNEGKPFEVNVYSSCETVELFLNGKSLGKKPVNRSTEFTAVWQVPYQPGELKAVGYRGKKKVNESVLRTAQEPAQLKLSADRTTLRADGQDLSYITVEVTDAAGNKDPKATNNLSFAIEGPGEIAAVGNANPVSTESFQQPQRKAWQGKCLVIVRSTKQAGTITVKVTSPGLTAGTTSIQSK